MSRSRRRSSRTRRAIDAAEDELYGEARGDELPEGLRTSGDRRKVLREAKQALDAERAAQAKKIPRDRSERLVECRRRLRQDWELERRVVTEHAAWHAAGIASDGSRRMVGARHNIKPYPLPPGPAGKINVTDPDSRNLKTTRGWVQGYNAQAVVGEGQIILAAEISTESLDTANLAADDPDRLRELRRAGVTETPGMVLADAGYWTNDAIETLCGEGIPTLVAPDADRRKQPRPGRRGGRYDFARRVLASDWGKQLYLKTPGQRRARLRADQEQPRRRPLPAPRTLSRQIRMAAADRDPQPPQAPPTPTRHRLNRQRAVQPGRAATRRAPKRPARPAPALATALTPPNSHTLSATPSAQSDTYRAAEAECCWQAIGAVGPAASRLYSRNCSATDVWRTESHSQRRAFAGTAARADWRG